MRINTKLKMAALAPLLMALVVGIAAWFEYGAMQLSSRRTRSSELIIQSMNNLHSLVAGYLLHPDERPIQQFLAEHDYAGQLLSSAEFSDSELQPLIHILHDNMEMMRDLFLRMVVIHKQGQADSWSEELSRQRDVLAGQLLVRSRQAVADGLRLEEAVKNQVSSRQSRTSILIVLLILLAMLPFALLLARMVGGITRSLRTLHRGTETVGAGNLNHQINLAGEDELANLARAFDKMTRNLQEVTVSRNELEQRVQERTSELSQTIQTITKQSEQLRQVTAQLAFTEQRERQRLAQVLHDGLQQILVGAKYRIITAIRSRNTGNMLDQVTDLIDNAIETSRSLTIELSPPILLQGNLSSALEWLARWMYEKHELEVTLKAGENRSMPEEITLLFFQAARELLFNVVKHAGVRSACVELRHLDDLVLLTVEDGGKGFKSAQPSPGGTGLVSISERISYLGGRMDIHSEPGKGSRFELVMPLHPAKLDRKSTGEQPEMAVEMSSYWKSSRSGPGKKVRIMLVDDHMVVRQGFAELLRGEPDFDIAGEASDGESAVQLAKTVRPDVVLMDISMPGMDGIQATRIIRNQTPEIHVIGLSMFREQEQEAAMLEAGATAYLPKSGPALALIETIRSCAKSPPATVTSKVT